MISEGLRFQFEFQISAQVKRANLCLWVSHNSAWRPRSKTNYRNLLKSEPFSGMWFSDILDFESCTIVCLYWNITKLLVRNLMHLAWWWRTSFAWWCRFLSLASPNQLNSPERPPGSCPLASNRSRSEFIGWLLSSCLRLHLGKRKVHERL